MTTFSQLIDDTIIELVRPDLLQMMPSYLNQTIRELHMFSRDGTPVFYDDNRREELVTLSNMDINEGVYNWQIPNMALFQGVGALWYDSVGRYVQPGNPQTARIVSGYPGERRYWYRSGQYIVFSDAGRDGQTVRVMYYEYPRSLVYYPDGKSPILFNRETGLYELNPNRQDQTLTYDQAMDRSTNWMLQRHEETQREGLRAKAWKRADDNNRAKLSYSTFETQKLGIQESAQAIYLRRYGT